MLNYGPPVDRPHSTVIINCSDLNGIILGTATMKDKISAGSAKVTGGPEPFETLLSLLDSFDFLWNLVTPNPRPKDRPRRFYERADSYSSDGRGKW